MNRFWAVLLIPFLTCGNVFPHTHPFSNAPSDHTQRRHIHIASDSPVHKDHHHGHHHHHRSDQTEGLNLAASTVPASLALASSTPVEHDSDAIYLGSEHLFLPISPGWMLNGDSGLVIFAPANQRPLIAKTPAIQPWSALANRAGPPLFVLHAALRL